MNRHYPFSLIRETFFSDPKSFQQRLENLRPELYQMRMSYRQFPYYIDYRGSKKYVYLLAYYPFYIDMLYNVLNNNNCIKFLQNAAKNSANAAFFGAGPAPEAIGLLSFIKDKLHAVNQARLFFFEMNPEWENIRERLIRNGRNAYWGNEIIQLNKSCNILRCPECFNQICNEMANNCQLFIFQNFLGDIIHTDTWLKNIQELIQRIRQKSILIIIDLNYHQIREAMEAIESIIIDNGFVFKSASTGVAEIRPNIERDCEIDAYFFDINQPYLKPKYSVRFYSSIIFLNIDVPIFTCSNDTIKEVFRRSLFGDSGSRAALQNLLIPGNNILLYNVNAQDLIGPFKLINSGFNIVPEAWGGNFPFQVKVDFQQENLVRYRRCNIENMILFKGIYVPFSIPRSTFNRLFNELN